MLPFFLIDLQIVIHLRSGDTSIPILFIYPEDWYIAANISKNRLWIVSYGDLPILTLEKCKAIFQR